MRRSRIWSIPEEELSRLWSESETMKKVLGYFGLEDKGGNGRTIRRRAKELELDIGKFRSNSKKTLRGWKFLHPKATPTEVFARKSKTQGGQLREALIETGRPYKCEACGLGGVWNGKEITLPVDHKDGDTGNNEETNLRFLCPNCHSQTPNFCGKKNKRDGRRNPRPFLRKVKRPTKEHLKEMLWETPTTKIAELYGVSDKAVEKWAKAYGIKKPPVGYWQRKKGS